MKLGVLWSGWLIMWMTTFLNLFRTCSHWPVLPLGSLIWICKLATKRESGFLPCGIVCPSSKKSPLTAEHALCLMLSLVRRLPQAHSSTVERGEWNRDDFCSRQLSSLRLGIVGLGRIGRWMARYAKTIGMEVAAHDPYVSSWKLSNRRSLFSCPGRTLSPFRCPYHPCGLEIG